MALTPVRCESERFGAWQRGHVFLPDLNGGAAEAFRGLVQTAVLEWPFEPSGRFQWKAGADDWMTNRSSLGLTVHHNRTDGLEEALASLRLHLSSVREFLSGTGTVWVFADQRASAEVRLLLDSVFGRSGFLNEIIWARQAGRNPTGRFTRAHDTIFLYRKGSRALFNAGAAGRARGRLKSHMKRVEEGGRAYYERESGGRVYRYFEDDPVSIGDVWADIPELCARDEERTGWDGQRPEALLSRMLAATSSAGSVVCAVPSGSGTAAAAAQRLGMRAMLVGSHPAERMLARRRLLLTGAEGFNFSGGCEPPDAQPEVAAELSGSAVQLGVYHYSASHPNRPGSLLDEGLGSLEYWAAGRFLVGAFTANAYSMRTRQQPTLGKTLDAGPGPGQPCVHLVDASGEQWFYLLD